MFTPSPLPRTLEASLRDLGSKTAATRASAIRDLVRHALRDEGTRARAIGLLSRALEDDAPGVRSAAAVALADLSAHEALPALLVAVEDPDAHARQMAISALGEIGDARAAPRLRRALTDDRPEVRYQAVLAFSRVRKDDADDVAAALLSALDDADDAVRYIALRIAEERLDQGVATPFEAIADRAVALLEDSTRHVALGAAILLSKLGRPEGRELVLRVIRGDAKADKEDEREAVEVAGALGMREALPALERRAWGLKRFVRDTCAFHAKIALARLGHERAVGEILRDLGAAKRETREAAVVAAGRAHLVQARDRIVAAKEVDAQLVAEALRDLGSAEAESGSA